MVTKSKLMQYRKLRHEIKDISSRIEKCNEQALSDYYTKIKESYVDELLEIERAIDTLPSDKRQLMRYRYIDGWSWKKIDDALHISESTSIRWHRESLKQICDS